MFPAFKPGLAIKRAPFKREFRRDYNAATCMHFGGKMRAQFAGKDSGLYGLAHVTHVV